MWQRFYLLPYEFWSCDSFHKICNWTLFSAELFFIACYKEFSFLRKEFPILVTNFWNRDFSQDVMHSYQKNYQAKKWSSQVDWNSNNCSKEAWNSLSFDGIPASWMISLHYFHPQVQWNYFIKPRDYNLWPTWFFIINHAVSCYQRGRF